MLKPVKCRVDSVADGQTWTFIDDVRVVGELTEVFCTIASGAIIEGWATITAYRSCMAEGAIPGMCVTGPVFSTAKRANVLDLHPIFSRLKSIITPSPFTVSPTRE